MGKVDTLLDESIEAEGYVIKDRQELYGASRVNLSQIDFEAWKRSFMREKKHIHAERLKNAVKVKVTNMVRLNRSRTNFLGKLQQMIVAKRLLSVLRKEKLVLDWRKRQQTRADVVLTIQNILDEGLPRSYTPAVYQHKCDLVYQHVYDA